MNAMLKVNGVETSYDEDVFDLEKLLLFFMEKNILQQEIVVEVKVDGKVFSEDYTNHAQVIYLDKVKNVEINTQTKEVFAKEFLKQVPEYINNLEKGFLNAAWILKSQDQKKDGYDMLANSIEAMQAVKSHLDNVWVILKQDNEQKGLNFFWKRFERLADEIINAQKKNDAELVAKLLENTLHPFLCEWKQKLRNLLE